MPKTALMFSGQGAQRVGMGREYYEQCRDIFDIDPYVRDLCFDGPQELLNETVNTQKATMMVSVAAYRCLAEDTQVFAAAGFSVGEYAALVAADVLDYATAYGIISLRAQLMQQQAQSVKGGMTAVLGVDADTIADTINAVKGETSGVLELVNYNCPGQIVISGEIDALESAEAAFSSNGIKYKRLPVSGAFHTGLMQSVRDRLQMQFSDMHFRQPKFKLVSNVTGEYYQGDMRTLLAQQVMCPVLWDKSIRTLMNSGVENFIEVGVGNVLSTFLRRIKKSYAHG